MINDATPIIAFIVLASIIGIGVRMFNKWTDVAADRDRARRSKPVSEKRYRNMWVIDRDDNDP